MYVRLLIVCLLHNVEFSDAHYCPQNDGNEPSKETVASNVPEKTIQITVDQRMSR